MKTSLISLLAGLLLLASLHAQNTPLTEAIPDETLTNITCELAQAPKRSEVPVFKSQQEADKSKGTYHYKLWLPAGYNATPTKAWPCIFIMSPSGNANLGNMKAYLQANGFIAVLLAEAKNGGWEPIVGNFLAAHDDAVKRVRILEGRKYATGFSGGARGSSVFVQTRPGFCGLILQGAGFSFDAQNNYNAAGIKSNGKLHVALTMGKSDSNQPEVEQLKRVLPGSRLAVFEFVGGHQWASAEIFEKAMASLEDKGTGPKTGEKSSGEPFDIFKK